MLIGYARCSAERDDLLEQRRLLRGLGVDNKRIYVDRGLAGDPPRPALEKAIAAAGRGDTVVVTRLSRLARSMRDAHAIGARLAAGGIKLSLGGDTYDPRDRSTRRLFELLETFAEFEVELLSLRTREGMAVARANGKLRGRRPKLSAPQHDELLKLFDTGDHTVSDLAARFGVSRATVYRELDRDESRPGQSVH